ncbi:hypothetical protein D3C78_1490420 [compost metagenome]
MIRPEADITETGEGDHQDEGDIQRRRQEVVPTEAFGYPAQHPAKGGGGRLAIQQGPAGDRQDAAGGAQEDGSVERVGFLRDPQVSHGRSSISSHWSGAS